MASKKSRKRGVSGRLGAVVIIITIAAVGLVARLVQLQVIDHSHYAAEARDIHVAKETVTGRRGALLDRNGYPLAASKDTYDVMVEVKAWKDGKAAAEAAAAIAAVTKGDPQKMVSEVEGAEIYEIAVARSLDFAAAAEIRELGPRGGRPRPGLPGLEPALESLGGGARGTVICERDGLGNQLALGSRSERDPQPGSQAVLTIDRFVQRMAERELDRAIKEHKASGGTIIAGRPKTGEILAMAGRPTFDPTNPDLRDDA